MSLHVSSAKEDNRFDVNNGGGGRVTDVCEEYGLRFASADKQLACIQSQLDLLLLYFGEQHTRRGGDSRRN